MILKDDYWTGLKNRIVRYFFYLRKGLELTNEFRYLIMAILGIYYTLRLTNPWWMLAMFFIAVPLLLILGYLSVHVISKVIDYLNIKYSTHWSKYGYELQEKTLQTLEEIQKVLKKEK